MGLQLLASVWGAVQQTRAAPARRARSHQRAAPGTWLRCSRARSGAWISPPRHARHVGGATGQRYLTKGATTCAHCPAAAAAATHPAQVAEKLADHLRNAVETAQGKVDYGGQVRAGPGALP